jgi:hypothetical protein
MRTQVAQVGRILSSLRCCSRLCLPRRCRVDPATPALMSAPSATRRFAPAPATCGPLACAHCAALSAQRARIGAEHRLLPSWWQRQLCCTAKTAWVTSGAAPTFRKRAEYAASGKMGIAFCCAMAPNIGREPVAPPLPAPVPPPPASMPCPGSGVGPPMSSLHVISPSESSPAVASSSASSHDGATALAFSFSTLCGDSF